MIARKYRRYKGLWYTRDDKTSLYLNSTHRLMLHVHGMLSRQRGGVRYGFDGYIM